MNIYAIGDLHLSGDPPAKPMEIFGPHWQGHAAKVAAKWRQLVSPDDTVIICGDTSWAMDLTGALPDLNWIAALPGRKILLRGNHDYWWSSLKKMQTATENKFSFLQNNFYTCGSTAICGSRGWLLPSSDNFSADDAAIYRREGLRLEASLAAARSSPHCTIRRCMTQPMNPFSPTCWSATASATAFSGISTAATPAWFLKAYAMASPINLSAVIRKLLPRSW